ncbi:hypothetical protein AB3662_05720 [Sorangium cellulosum]|uniref:hypothetical protein n=1 Tax=Sorangium cellulosum TaxID=56 RepID=UPI003D9A7830
MPLGALAGPAPMTLRARWRAAARRHARVHAADQSWAREPGKQVHIILEVTDKGTPPLTNYQRVVVTIRRHGRQLAVDSVDGSSLRSPERHWSVVHGIWVSPVVHRLHDRLGGPHG